MDNFFSNEPCPHCLGSGHTFSQQSIAQSVHLLLSTRGWSAATLAHELNVSRAFLSLCLSGQRQWPISKLQLLHQLAYPATADAC